MHDLLAAIAPTIKFDLNLFIAFLLLCLGSLLSVLVCFLYMCVVRCIQLIFEASIQKWSFRLCFVEGDTACGLSPQIESIMQRGAIF